MLASDETESLEAFLDGESSEQQADVIRRQIDPNSASWNPAIAAALQQLIGERELRGQWYATFERHDSAEDEVVGRLLANVERELDRDERRMLAHRDRMRMLRYVVGAAACVVFSFFAGWIGHGRSGDSLNVPTVAVTNRNNASQGSLDFGGAGTLVSNIKMPAPDGTVGNAPLAIPGGVNVALTDNLGRIIAVQHFDTLNEAREFTQDVTHLRQQQQQMRQGDTVLVKDQF
ncbi:MAG: hypothetical protein JO353_06415 [Phycisphaerae bacterium]|nr:hypothetical protein [Phycisphaerae bacterium]